MGKLVMAHLDVNEEELEVRISDIQRINRVPEVVLNVIKENIHGRIINKSGLPTVSYLGPNHCVVVGAFEYGEVAFPSHDIVLGILGS